MRAIHRESVRELDVREPGLPTAPVLVGSTMGKILTVLHTVVYGVLVVGGVCLVLLVRFELVQRLVPGIIDEEVET